MHKWSEFQSTHPVRGGTYSSYDLYAYFDISIHPPRAGWDWIAVIQGEMRRISIHPPRAGWDSRAISTNLQSKLFQSTHPVRGGTTVEFAVIVTDIVFQSTHPVRGGTW